MSLFMPFCAHPDMSLFRHPTSLKSVRQLQAGYVGVVWSTLGPYDLEFGKSINQKNSEKPQGVSPRFEKSLYIIFLISFVQINLNPPH